jgi:hypothetical protein
MTCGDACKEMGARSTTSRAMSSPLGARALASKVASLDIAVRYRVMLLSQCERVDCTILVGQHVVAGTGVGDHGTGVSREADRERSTFVDLCGYKMSDDRDCEIAAFAVNARQMPVRRGRVQFKIRVFETMDCALPTLETADFINISSLRGTI